MNFRTRATLVYKALSPVRAFHHSSTTGSASSLGVTVNASRFGCLLNQRYSPQLECLEFGCSCACLEFRLTLEPAPFLNDYPFQKHHQLFRDALGAAELRVSLTECQKRSEGASNLGTSNSKSAWRTKL